MNLATLAYFLIPLIPIIGLIHYRKSISSWINQDKKGIVFVLILLTVYSIFMTIKNGDEIMESVRSVKPQSNFTATIIATLGSIDFGKVGLALILAFFSGLIATYLNVRYSMASLEEAITKQIRLGISKVRNPSTESNPLELIRTAENHVYVMRTLVDTANQLPTEELKIVLAKGCNVDIVLPHPRNEFLELRKKVAADAKNASPDSEETQKAVFIATVERLADIYYTCKSTPKFGVLRLALYTGPFVINVFGNEHEWQIAVLWQHLTATQSPQISLLEGSDLGRCAAQHFKEVWKIADEGRQLFELDRNASGYISIDRLYQKIIPPE